MHIYMYYIYRVVQLLKLILLYFTMNKMHEIWKKSKMTAIAKSQLI